MYSEIKKLKEGIPDSDLDYLRSLTKYVKNPAFRSFLIILYF